MRIFRFLSVATVALALPIGLSAGVAGAQTPPAGQDRVAVSTDTNLADTDNLFVDVRVVSLDDDGDALGVRSRTSSSDVQGLEHLQTDTRTVSSDQDGDALAARAIVGFDDLSGLDDLDSDIDVVSIDHDRNDSDGSPGITGQQNDEQYEDDTRFVFGQ
jgi:hypothetical protein